MITEAAYIAYFAGLAAKHKQIRHGIDGRNAFFFIPMAMDLGEIDKAIRADKATPLLAIDALSGTFDDAQSDRHLQTINGQFFVLDKATTGEQESIRTVQDTCLKIGQQILARMKVDLKGTLTDGPIAKGNRFTIHNVQYDQVGPMAATHYGYTFRFTITCPFSFKVDSAIWSDK